MTTKRRCNLSAPFIEIFCSSHIKLADDCLTFQSPFTGTARCGGKLSVTCARNKAVRPLRRSLERWVIIFVTIHISMILSTILQHGLIKVNWSMSNFIRCVSYVFGCEFSGAIWWHLYTHKWKIKTGQTTTTTTTKHIHMPLWLVKRNTTLWFKPQPDKLQFPCTSV